MPIPQDLLDNITNTHAPEINNGYKISQLDGSDRTPTGVGLVLAIPQGGVQYVSPIKIGG